MWLNIAYVLLIAFICSNLSADHTDKHPTTWKVKTYEVSISGIRTLQFGIRVFRLWNKYHDFYFKAPGIPHQILDCPDNFKFSTDLSFQFQLDLMWTITN